MPSGIRCAAAWSLTSAKDLSIHALGYDGVSQQLGKCATGTLRSLSAPDEPGGSIVVILSEEPEAIVENYLQRPQGKL